MSARAYSPENLSCLDVQASFMGRRWASRCDSSGLRMALALSQTYAIPEILARVLAGRGITVAQAQGFLDPKLRDLMPDPLILRDMEKAVARIAMAVIRRESIAIFGDYDVDGACSVALLASFLQQAGLDPLIHIPDRITEGYGPNVQAMRLLHERGARLLVTVDCGASGGEAFEEAHRLGLDVVVLDHHQVPENPPAVAALVDPNRQDDLSGLGYLCAAGVVFLTLIALRRDLIQKRFSGWQQGPPDLLGLLDLVALATIADVVPLKNLNRAFVRHGLTVMKARRRPGLAALFDAAGLKTPPQAWHLGFLIGPRINAGGRIGDASLGAKLLLMPEGAQAVSLAANLDRLNRERQTLETLALKQAERLAEDQLAQEPEKPVLAIFSPDWHPGIVGLIAARLKERYQRPAFAFAAQADGDCVTGSGRSLTGVDLGRAVRILVEEGLALRGGGHAMAAGITLPANTLDDFSSRIASLLRPQVQEARATADVLIDAILHPAGLSPHLYQALEQAGPFGSGHPEPLFAFPDMTLLEANEMGSGGHVKARFKGQDGAYLTTIAFRAVSSPLGETLFSQRGQRFHIAGHLSLNSWGGRETVELRLIDIARA
jgi:single-stranded-DNA-specific exonuclease